MMQLNTLAFQKARRHLFQGLGLGLSGFVLATPANATVSAPPPSDKRHCVLFQVDSSDEKVIGHAISGTMNLSRVYMQAQQPFEIEIVANSSGIQMFRADTSPVAEPLAALRSAIPHLTFTVCGSAATIASAKEGRDLVFLPGVQVVPYGIARIVELQEAGWSYVHG